MANVESVVSVYDNSPVINFLDVSSIALVIFDYLLLFDQEVEYMWKSKWTITKAAFFYLRYMPILESVVLLYWTSPFPLMELAPSVPLCTQAYKTSMALAIPGIMVGEMTLSIRTWAVWKQDRRVGIGLIFFSLATAIPGIVSMILFIRTAQFGLDTTLGVPSCGLDGGSRIIAVLWIALMVYDATLLVLMIISARIWNLKPTFKNVFNYSSDSDPDKLLEPILREGILYYFYLFVLSALNVVVIFIMPPDFMNMMAMLERMIHSVLTCRVILHIRKGGRSNKVYEAAPTLTAMGDTSEEKVPTGVMVIGRPPPEYYRESNRFSI